jgi:hypothetical protein
MAWSRCSSPTVPSTRSSPTVSSPADDLRVRVVDHGRDRDRLLGRDPGGEVVEVETSRVTGRTNTSIVPPQVRPTANASSSEIP